MVFKEKTYPNPIFCTIYIAFKLVWYKTLSFYSWSWFLSQPTPTLRPPSYPYLLPTLLPLPPTHSTTTTFNPTLPPTTYLLLPHPLPTYLPPTPTYLPSHTTYLSLPPAYPWPPTLPPTYPYLLLTPLTTFCHFVTSFFDLLFLFSTVLTCTSGNWSPLDHLTYPLPYPHLSLPFLSTLSFHYTASSPPQLLSNFLWFILLFSYYLHYIWYG